jgi:hypothetical protein
LIDFKTLIAICWVVMFGGGVALGGVFALSYSHVKIGRLEFRLGMRTYRGLAYLIMGPAVAIAVAGSFITMANTGQWPPGDYRDSEIWVGLCWLLVLAVAPLSALWGAGILARQAWHSRHARKESAGDARVHAEVVTTGERPSPGAADRKDKKTKRGA